MVIADMTDSLLEADKMYFFSAENQAIHYINPHPSTLNRRLHMLFLVNLFLKCIIKSSPYLLRCNSMHHTEQLYLLKVCKCQCYLLHKDDRD